MEINCSWYYFVFIALALVSVIFCITYEPRVLDWRDDHSQTCGIVCICIFCSQRYKSPSGVLTTAEGDNHSCLGRMRILLPPLLWRKLGGSSLVAT